MVALVAVTAATPAMPDGDALWQQWSGRRLRLSDTVGVHEHRYRGRRWYLLRESLGGKQYRLTASVYRFIALLDGRRTIAEALAHLATPRSGTTQARGELLTTLSQLHADGLLAGEQLHHDVRPELGALAVVRHVDAAGMPQP